MLSFGNERQIRPYLNNDGLNLFRTFTVPGEQETK